MAFGGYKFAGFRVDNSQYATSETRCLAIHAARVRAFLTASSLAGNPWIADSDKLTGELDLNVGTGAITSGVNNGIIHEFKVNNVAEAYSSYFKYSSGETTGYYYILTIVMYGIGSSDYGDIVLPKASCLQMFWGSGSSEYYYKQFGPHKASCLHCFSLDPFPSSLHPSDFNLEGLRATRLCAIGTNWIKLANQNYGGGYVNYSNLKTLFGYAVRDTDIIVFSGSNGISSYVNPFSSVNGGHVNILSLKGFSELYIQNDNYELLQLDIKNLTTDDTSNNHDESEAGSNHRGRVDQVLDCQTGDPLINTKIQHLTQAFVLTDQRTLYNTNGAQSTPYCGLQIAVKDDKNASYGETPYTVPFSNSTQLIKGSTNPELVAMNASRNQLSYNAYSPSIDGNLLYLYSISPNYWTLIAFNSSVQASNSNAWCNSYYHFYIGWDSSNPDIKSDLAWPEYNATV